MACGNELISRRQLTLTKHATPKNTCSTPSLALSGGNLGQVVHITTQYNFVPVKGRWCPAAGKVTVGLASH